MLGVRAVASYACAVALFACGARTELDAARGAASDAPPDAACVAGDFTLQVPATTAWTDTGIDVVAGTTLTIHASGTVKYGGMASQVTGPNGGNFDGQKFFSTAVLPGAVVVSLIGKIDETPLPEGTPGDGAGFVGASYQITVPASGRLFLGFNDQRQAFGDNAGSFSVTVSVSC